MNWRRGLLRLWLVASLLWIGFLGWIGYERHVLLSCFNHRKANPSLGNPFDCFPATGFPEYDYLVPAGAKFYDYFIAAFVPIMGTLIIGMIVAWVASGFRPKT
jgi:hypothetical protein